MKQIGSSNYFIHEGKLYKEIKPINRNDTQYYYLTNKAGARKWYKSEEFIQKHS